MDAKQLRALLAVGDHRSFSGAARALHTVQSNISAHVARLERELNVTLVDRATNDLTEEGRVVAARARRIESEFAAIVDEITSLRSEVTGTIRIGIIGTTARWLVPRLLGALSERHPRVRLSFLDGTSTVLVPQLVAGRIDLAVVNLPADGADVAVSELFVEDRLLVVPSAHPLAQHDHVSIEQVAAHPLLLDAPGTSSRQVLDEWAAANGVTLQAQAEIDGLRLLASLAFSGYGAAILPASAAPPLVGGDWKAIPLQGAPQRAVGLARRRRGLPTAAERAVADAVTDTVAGGENLPTGVYPAARA